MANTDALNTLQVDDLVVRIQNHLDILETRTDFSSDSAEQLVFPNGAIDYRCLIHYLSLSDTFLAEYRDQCRDILLAHTDMNVLDLDTLLKLQTTNTQDDYIKDKEFYLNLYQFDIQLARFLLTNEFDQANLQTKFNVINGIKQFYKQTIKYSTQYMNHYQIINNDIINANYNILYLLNSLQYNRYTVATGTGATGLSTNTEELVMMYTQLLDSIDHNIGLYDKLNMDQFTSLNPDTIIPGTAESQSSRPSTGTYDNLINRLREQRAILESQGRELESNINLINNDRNSLKSIVQNSQIKEYGDELVNLEL